MSGIRRWTESEDWVELYDRGRIRCLEAGRYEVEVTVGGPGRATPWRIYARVAAGAEDVITGVEMPTATPETHPQNKPLEPAHEVRDIPGTPPGYAWVYLGKVTLSRGYYPLILHAPNGLAGIDRICALQVHDRILSGEVERRIARAALSPEPLSGVPLGGVGAGKIELCRDGIFRNLTINGNIDTPIRRSEGSFFAVHAVANGQAGARILTEEALHDLPPVESLDYEGVYPQCRLTASDRYFPVTVQVEGTGPIIPRDGRQSSLPLALFNVRVTASGDDPVRATFAFAFENVLGIGGSSASVEQRQRWDEGYYHLWEERAGNREVPWEDAEAAGILFDGTDKEEPRSAGQYVLATDAPVAGRLCGWRLDDPAPWQTFMDTGALPAAAAEASTGEATAAALAVQVDLQPGETRDIRFVFAWYVPVFWQAMEFDYGHFYENVCASAAEVARYGLANFESLVADAAEVPDLLLQSSLPDWFARSLANDAYTLTTDSWYTRDGRFAINEGASQMFGCMGTLDQKLYGNHYFTLFFPELDRTELLGFARAQRGDGGIQHDLGFGHLEQREKPSAWPDLSSALVILSLKHYQLTGDQDYIDEVYPHCVKALLDYQLGLDSDGDGIANISGVGNTFDAERFEGTSAYIATVWLAALKALEDLAERRGDTATADRCRDCFATARTNAIDELWNGRFFANYYDTTKKSRHDTSHYSQLAGEFFARLLGLGPLYGDTYARPAQAAINDLNFPAAYRMPTNDATVEGRMTTRKMWGWAPHGRTYLGGQNFTFGDPETGLRNMQRIDAAIAEVNHGNYWDQRLFYEPDTGREHWGRHYMTSPASWYVYQAMVGWQADLPGRRLTVVPNLPGSLLPFAGPIFLPDWWAWLTVDRDAGALVIETLRCPADSLPITTLELPTWAGAPRVVADGRSVPLTPGGPAADGRRAYAVSLDLAEVGEIVIEWLR